MAGVWWGEGVHDGGTCVAGVFCLNTSLMCIYVLIYVAQRVLTENSF